jgi:hypothetical protein
MNTRNRRKPPAERADIRRFRGIYKLKPGEKPATKELFEDRDKEIRREN